MTVVLLTENIKSFGSFAVVSEIGEDEGSITPRAALSKTSELSSYGDGDGDGDGDDLLEELIMHEILPRFPIKSLFRFKLVCKKWLNFITHEDPLFITYHSYKGPNRTNITSANFFCYKKELVISSDPQYYQLKLSLPTFINRLGPISGSTNGLVYGFCTRPAEIFICNPITKHVVYVPNPKKHAMIAVAADPYNPNFGFMVIAIVVEEYDDPNFFQFEVYSSKTGEWRVSNAELRVPNLALFRMFQAHFVGRKVYWSLVRHLVWFDVEVGVAGLLPCPDHNNLVFMHPGVKAGYTEIGVCNSELSYSKMTKEGDIEIWLLRNNRGGNHQRYNHNNNNNEFEWVKKHTVRMQPIVEENWNIMSQICGAMKIKNQNAVVKAFTRRRSVYALPYLGGEVVWFWMQINYGELFSINLRTQELKLINNDFCFNLSTQELKLINNDFHIPLPLYPFIPTLLPCPT